MTDFRALCAELANHLQARVSKEDQEISTKAYYSQAQRLIDGAWAALNEPAVEEWPTDEEWDALVESVWDKYETVGHQGERFMYDSDFGNALELVRKELTRCSRGKSDV